ncbi:MAG: hypothetical protein Q4Q03_08125 [Bowdeniella nasicola]|nr:hypothetical protein [Bowdeniella nasicola]
MENRDLLTLGEREAPTLQIPAAARTDTIGRGEDSASRTPTGIDRNHGIGDEITCLHPCPKDLQEIRPEQD